ncbi:SEL1-like repeat protein [Erwinia sp. CGal63]|uniref:SEL1-like repeat protein n=1 Tax=Erwinia sp. CGal63 TaxID=2919889 RepID=UPI00300B5050
MRRLLLLCGLLLAGCDGSPTPIHRENAVKPLTEIKARLAFTCKHESMPEPPAEADVLFKYARWLQVNNQLKRDPAVDAESARLYRIAAENGHVKAAINLQNGALRGQYLLSAAERIRMSQRLIDEGVATGYYFIALYLQHGAAGLAKDEEMALRYFRKAADEGNAQAQAWVGKKLVPADRAPEVARQMLRCAAEQGDGEAARSLAINYKIKGEYVEAIELFQLGVAAGDESSASFLEHGFDGPEATDRLYYLDQQKDPERVSRYEKIWRILANYSYAHPKVPEINEIVPLPPAALPEWDGKLRWLEAREANIAPPQPDVWLIAELARRKQLNPETGRPLPTSPDFEKYTGASLLCDSGNACPRSGYWQVSLCKWEWLSEDVPQIRYFAQGNRLPRLRVSFMAPRIWPLSDRHVSREQPVSWQFIGEA